MSTLKVSTNVDTFSNTALTTVIIDYGVNNMNELNSNLETDNTSDEENWYPWFDKEDFYDEIGDQIYYGVFHPEANLELAVNNLDHIRSFQLKNVPLSPLEVCQVIDLMNLVNSIYYVCTKINSTKNMETKNRLEIKYSGLRDKLLEKAPHMTHTRLELGYDSERYEKIKRDPINLYPDDTEQQANYCLRCGC